LPHPFTLNIEKAECFGYIKYFSCLLANCSDIDISNKNIDEKIKNYCKNLKIKEYSPKKYEDTEFYYKKIKETKEKIKSYFLKEKKNKINFNIIKYEKDSKDTKQFDFVYNSSILRADNFNIEKENKFNIKIMAGEIMPSVITSTTCIAALLSLQLYAFCQKNNYKYLRVGMIDLSDNTINLATPSLI